MTEMEFMSMIPDTLEVRVEAALEEVMCEVLSMGCETEDEVKETIDFFIWKNDEDLNNIYYRMQDLVKAHYPEHNAQNMTKQILTDIMCERLSIN